MANALKSQVGGDHYSRLKIQPMEYSMANGLDPCQHNIIKYATRFRDKGGISDLEKLIHTAELMIAFERKRLKREKKQRKANRRTDSAASRG